jgi:hypothetical protein
MNTGDQDDWLTTHFGVIYPEHVSAFARLLIVLRDAFGGDLDQLLILTVIGDRHHQLRQDLASLRYATFAETPWRDSESATINIHSVATFTGIPRETVRRKVGALIGRGWVERDPGGDLHPTAQAALDLRPCTEAALDYLRTVVTTCDRVRGA